MHRTDRRTTRRKIGVNLEMYLTPASTHVEQSTERERSTCEGHACHVAVAVGCATWRALRRRIPPPRAPRLHPMYRVHPDRLRARSGHRLPVSCRSAYCVHGNTGGDQKGGVHLLHLVDHLDPLLPTVDLPHDLHPDPDGDPRGATWRLCCCCSRPRLSSEA